MIPPAGQHPVTIAPWQAEPHRLWSLLDMLRQFKAWEFFRLAEVLADNSRAARAEPTATYTEADRARVSNILDSVVAVCDAVGWLDQSSVYARRMRGQLEHITAAREYGEKLEILIERVRDELATIVSLYIAKERVHYYTDKQPFGESVANAFPRAATDIEEASKCLACGRSTACVFHLMRVMEEGLKHVAKRLGIPYAPSWESYIKQIQTQIDEEWRKKTRLWKRDEPFFRDVLAHLHAVKVAWRNPTMHIVNDYTPEMAEDVFNSVRGLMRHLAAKLGDKPRKTKPVAVS